jgi:hypothetical protein
MYLAFVEMRAARGESVARDLSRICGEGRGERRPTRASREMYLAFVERGKGVARDVSRICGEGRERSARCISHLWRGEGREASGEGVARDVSRIYGAASGVRREGWGERREARGERRGRSARFISHGCAGLVMTAHPGTGMSVCAAPVSLLPRAGLGIIGDRVRSRGRRLVNSLLPRAGEG